MLSGIPIHIIGILAIQENASTGYLCSVKSLSQTDCRADQLPEKGSALDKATEGRWLMNAYLNDIYGSCSGTIA